MKRINLYYKDFVNVLSGALVLLISMAGCQKLSSSPDKVGNGSGSKLRLTAVATYLPFNMPNRSVLRASSKKVFAHYFTAFPLSIDNVSPSSDYYTNQYLAPNGEGGIHQSYGGYLRDRPMTNIARPRAGDYELEDLKTEVQNAKNAGLDGFVVDILSGSSSPLAHWGKLVKLLQAANAIGDFDIILSPDGSAGFCSSSTQVANDLALVASNACLYKISGKIVIAPFAPEMVRDVFGFNPATFWSEVKTKLSAKNIQIQLWPYYVKQWDTHADCFPALNSISYGHGRWGDADATSAGDATVNNGGAVARLNTLAPGKPWMHYARSQDNRPNEQRAWEAWNSKLLRTSFETAINTNAPFVQIPTWNDLRENAYICPSRDNGYALLDLVSYYIAWYKTGTRPTIVRDAVYISHKKHHSSINSFTSGQSTRMAQAGPTPIKDEAEVLLFLTGETWIRFNLGGVWEHKPVFGPTYAGPELKIPSGGGPVIYSRVISSTTVGEVRCEVVRNGVNVPRTNAVSPHLITLTPLNQDFTYRYTSSLRQNP